MLGCESRSTTRHHLSGIVTWQGKPVPAGRIIFSPVRTKDFDTDVSYAPITNGHFDTAVKGLGHFGGPYDLIISGFDGVPREHAPLGAPLFQTRTLRESLPARLNTMQIDL